MKKNIVSMLFVIALIFSGSSISEAYQNEPNGFRDLYWGQTYANIIQNHEIYNKSGMIHWALTNPYIAGVPIDNFIYRKPVVYLEFKDNQLYLIYITFKETSTIKEDNQKIYEALVKQFGEPTNISVNEHNITFYQWFGTTTNIKFACSSNSRPSITFEDVRVPQSDW